MKFLNLFELTIRRLAGGMALAGSLFVGASVAGLNAADERPNIVIILADDLGYGDVGFTGGTIATPNLDRLVADGVKLDQFYVAPMCTPTRAGLMTGRYPIRFGLMRSVVPPHRDFGLDPAEDTLPEMLGRVGYAHRACIGKWHLGHARPEWSPRAQGFTDFVGCLNGAIDYFTHERDGQLDWHRNGQPYRVEGYATDILADAAVEFIETVPSTEPYLLYVPFNAPHGPFQAKEEDMARYPHLEGTERVYAAMVDSMDQGIGRILDAIDARGDAANTLVWFFSDNGGVSKVGSNGPQRGAKLTPYQGGIRVAAAIRWPAGGLSGGRRVDARMGYIDVMPTLKQVIGDQSAAVKPFDGWNVLASLRDEAELPDRPWFTYFDQNVDRQEHLAVNRDDVKLVVNRPAADSPAAESGTIELFAIRDDPEESVDQAVERSDVATDLLHDIEGFLQLRADPQIPRYAEGKKGFKAPEDWQIPTATTALTSRQMFTNPVAPVGHDPWVVQNDGVYYYCYADKNQLWINHSPDLTETVQFAGRSVWTPPEGELYSKQLWAPELHPLDGAWYIYVAASDGTNETHRMYVLRSDTPTGKFEFVGKIATPDDKWAIDGTVLEVGDQRYFVWSGWEGDENVAQHLYIAEMDSPESVSGERVKISSPELEWERRRGDGPKHHTLPFINEGPQVLQRNGRTFVVYSASGSWTNHYCLGQLELTGRDPMDPRAWTKTPHAVFASAEDVHAPGHACFTKSPDGTEDWVVYHTARFKGAGWKRETRMQPISWDQNGRPVLGSPVPSDHELPKPAGTPITD